MTRFLCCRLTRGILLTLLLVVPVLPAVGFPFLTDRGGSDWHLGIGKQMHGHPLSLPDERSHITYYGTLRYADRIPDPGLIGLESPGGLYGQLTGNLQSVRGFEASPRSASFREDDPSGARKAERALALAGLSERGNPIETLRGYAQKPSARRESTVMSIPEPISLVLLRSGLLGIGAASRRKEM